MPAISWPDVIMVAALAGMGAIMVAFVWSIFDRFGE